MLGDDGNIYTGNYGAGFVGNSYFRTIEDHICILTNRIEDNNQKITKIQEETATFVRQISELQEKSKVYNGQDGPVKKLIPTKQNNQ